MGGSVMPPHAVNIQSAPNPPRDSGRQSCPPVDSVMSSLNAALPHTDGMLEPPSLRSPAEMLSPTNSRRRDDNAGAAANDPSVLCMECMEGWGGGQLSTLQQHAPESIHSKAATSITAGYARLQSVEVTRVTTAGKEKQSNPNPITTDKRSPPD
jgi:hypothetical protein